MSYRGDTGFRRTFSSRAMSRGGYARSDTGPCYFFSGKTALAPGQCSNAHSRRIEKLTVSAILSATGARLAR
jgi:hypothetical protein